MGTQEEVPMLNPFLEPCVQMLHLWRGEGFIKRSYKIFIGFIHNEVSGKHCTSILRLWLSDKIFCSPQTRHDLMLLYVVVFFYFFNKINIKYKTKNETNLKTFF